MEEFTHMFASFGGTTGAFVIFAIWVNRKFNHIENSISYMKGKIGIDE